MKKRDPATARVALRHLVSVLPVLFLSAAADGTTAFASDDSREAGYAFAKRLNIVDVNRCGGPTPAFIEGCRAFASQLAAHQSFMPNGAYSTGNVGTRPEFYSEPIFSQVRQFE
jgi:hypothetical protein